MEGRPLDDGSLVERARRGDVDAYEELVQRYQVLAHRVAFLVTRDEAEAEDAVQEAFVKAYRALGRFRRGASFRPWLLTIVGNEARNRRRSEGRRAGLALRVAGEGLGGAAPSSEALALEADERRRLLTALESLPERDRLVISYRYLLDMSVAETAAALNVRPGTVKSRLSRALVRLREAFPAETVTGSDVRGRA